MEDATCNYCGRMPFKCGITMCNFLSGDIALGRVGRNLLEKTPLQPNAQHEQFGREYMTSILFDVRLRLENREDLLTDVKLNLKLRCPHGEIMYELTRNGAIVRTWRDGQICTGRSHNGVKYPIRVIATYKGRSHALKRYDPSNLTTENVCTTFLTSWIER